MLRKKKQETNDRELVELEVEGAKFSVPKKVTVREQLQYSSLSSSLNPADSFVKKWEAAKMLITEWECELMPDLDKIDIDELTDPRASVLLVRVSVEVMNHMHSLDDIEKNS